MNPYTTIKYFYQRIKVSTIILGKAIEYSPKQLSLFVISLRKYHCGRDRQPVKDINLELNLFKEIV